MAASNTITLPMRRPFRNVLQIKITLRETDPPIWRRILVPESYTFYDLHVAIQNAMGWTDSHLHSFEIAGGWRKKPLFRVECPFSEPEFEGEKILYTTDYFIKEYLIKTDDVMDYEYDFGDRWVHEVRVEEIRPRTARERYPKCLDGELACPPEDCGGTPGYYDCLEALKKRDDSEGLLTWLGRWRPDRFDPKAVVFESPRKRLEECLNH